MQMYHSGWGSTANSNVCFLGVVVPRLSTDYAFEGIPGNRSVSQFIHNLIFVFLLMLLFHCSQHNQLGLYCLLHSLWFILKTKDCSEHSPITTPCRTRSAAFPYTDSVAAYIKHKDLLKVRLPLVNVIISGCSSRRADPNYAVPCSSY